MLKLYLDDEREIPEALNFKKEIYTDSEMDFLIKYEEIVYDRGSKDEPDSFSQNRNLAIKKIEDLVRKYLK